MLARTGDVIYLDASHIEPLSFGFGQDLGERWNAPEVRFYFNLLMAIHQAIFVASAYRHCL